MRDIRALEEANLDDYVRLSVDAYPGMRASAPDDRQRMRDNLVARLDDDRLTMYGVFEQDSVVGVMRYHDFEMNFFGTRALVGGLGGVAVDLRHKKRRVAHDMVRHFHDHYRNKGACMAILYPFRPDFYRYMGYGYGSDVRHFRVLPDALPVVDDEPPVQDLSVDDADDAAACYERFLDRTHGLIVRSDKYWQALLGSHEVYVVGVRHDDRLAGYAAFQFQLGPADNFIRNDLYVREMVYDDACVLRSLLSYLRTQGDQVERILFNRQDDGFHHLLADPRNGTGNLVPRAVAHETNVVGLGMMYRVIGTPRLFEVLADHDFGGQTGTVLIHVTDTFLPVNDGATTVRFDRGRAEVVESGGHDVGLSMNVAAWSSMIVGAATVGSLVDLGLAKVSDPAWVPTLERLFAAPRPQCWTDF